MSAQFKAGDVVKYAAPKDEMDAATRLIVLEAHYDCARPRILVRLVCNWRIAPTDLLAPFHLTHA